MDRFTGILGMLTVLGLAYAFSANRQAIRYKTVAWGLGLQIAFAFLIMRWEYGRLFFEKLGTAANWLLDFAYYGTSFCISSAAHNHFYRGFIRGSLLPGNHATGREGSRARNDKFDGRKRSRVAERRG
jgi:CNT family concentrative nucleoside transporter